jgi:hypothetical protein
VTKRGPLVHHASQEEKAEQKRVQKEQRERQKAEDKARKVRHLDIDGHRRSNLEIDFSLLRHPRRLLRQKRRRARSRRRPTRSNGNRRSWRSRGRTGAITRQTRSA